MNLHAGQHWEHLLVQSNNECHMKVQDVLYKWTYMLGSIESTRLFRATELCHTHIMLVLVLSQFTINFAKHITLSYRSFSTTNADSNYTTHLFHSFLLRNFRKSECCINLARNGDIAVRSRATRWQPIKIFNLWLEPAKSDVTVRDTEHNISTWCDQRGKYNYK